MRASLKVYFTSLAFLSRLPIPASWQSADSSEFAKVPRAFWLAGVTIGLVVASMGAVFQALLPIGLALAVLVGMQILITGAFHEDGFADVADAVGGNTREKRFEIMADSRLGTFGVSALVSLVLIRWNAYLHIMTTDGLWRWFLWIVIVSGFSRWVTVLLLKVLPYVHPSGKGIGRSLQVPSWTELVITVFVLGVAALLLDWISTCRLVLALGISVGLCILFFKRWLGGANGDCLGAACVFAELMMLLAVSI